MFRLPNLIFAEQHEDPATARTLRRILPTLVQMGYGQYFDEFPSNCSKQDYIRLLEEQEAQYAELLTMVEEWNQNDSFSMQIALDVICRMANKPVPPINMCVDVQDTVARAAQMSVDERMEFLISATIVWLASKSRAPKHEAAGVLIGEFALLENPSQSTLENMMHLHGIVFKRESRQHWLRLFKNEMSGQVAYHGIDIGDAVISNLLTASGDVNEIVNHKRNESMAAAYANATVPTFGRIGLSHAKPIRELLLQKFDNKAEMVNASFCFIYLHSRPVLKVEDPDLLTLGGFDKLIEAQAALHANPPKTEGIVPINIEGKTDEEVISLITSLIQQRQQAKEQILAQIHQKEFEDSFASIMVQVQEQIQKKSLGPLFGISSSCCDCWIINRVT